MLGKLEVARGRIMPNRIEIKGLDKTLRKLSHPAHVAAAKRGLQAGAVHIKGTVDEYPPATEANSPGQPRWYERGYGPRWRRKSGGIGGRKSSETLGRKWTVASRNAGLTQIVGNAVSYGPFVQDEDRQASFHKRRGWGTIQKAAKEESGPVLRFVKAEIDKVLES